MPLLPTPNALPVLCMGIMPSPTSFSAHDLGGDTGRIQRVVPAEKSRRVVRRLQLLFATPLPFCSILAAW
jgi:hypothetical protein